MTRLLTHAARAPVLLYRWVLSPWLPPTCRFVPTCSTYALEAIERFGPAAGTGMALRRLCRCHPWGGMGYDPIPPMRDADTKHNPTFSFSDTPRF